MVNGNPKVEPNETFTVVLTSAMNASLGTITPNKALIQVNGVATKLTISGN